MNSSIKEHSRQGLNVIDVLNQELPFFNRKEIENKHELLLADFTASEVTADMLLSRHDIRFLIVALDYYECNKLLQDEGLVQLIGNNSRLYQQIFYELLLMSFIDNGHAQRFMKAVDLSKKKKFVCPPVVFPIRRPIARSFKDIINAIGTYSECKNRMEK